MFLGKLKVDLKFFKKKLDFLVLTTKVKENKDRLICRKESSDLTVLTVLIGLILPRLLFLGWFCKNSYKKYFFKNHSTIFK